MCQFAVSWLVDASGAGAILSVGLFRHPKLKWAKMEKLFNVDGGVSGGTILLCNLNVILQTTLLDSLTVMSDINLVKLQVVVTNNLSQHNCYHLSCMSTYRFTAPWPKVSAPLVAYAVVVCASSGCQCGLSATKLLASVDLSWFAELSANMHASRDFCFLLRQHVCSHVTTSASQLIHCFRLPTSCCGQSKLVVAEVHVCSVDFVYSAEALHAVQMPNSWPQFIRKLLCYPQIQVKSLLLLAHMLCCAVTGSMCFGLLAGSMSL